MLCAPTARCSLVQSGHKSRLSAPVETRLQCISAIAALASARLRETSTVSGRCRRRRRLEPNIYATACPRASRHITLKPQTNTDSVTDDVLDGATTTSPSSSTIPYTYNSPRPTSGSIRQPHYDLSSFLTHAIRTKLSPSRTVYKGTFYEYAVAAALKRLGFRLVRTGGASDRGVDLVGWWRVSKQRKKNVGGYGAAEATSTPLSSSSSSSSSIPTARPIRVVIQCKALRKGPRPSDVRELESTVGNAARFAFVGLELDAAAADDDDDDDDGTGGQEEDKEDTTQSREYHTNNNDNCKDDRFDTKDEEVLGLLVSRGSATRGVREALGRSQWPMGFLKVSTDLEKTDTTMTTALSTDSTTSHASATATAAATVVEQFIWNHAATEKWLTGLGVTVKYSDGDGAAAARSCSSPSAKEEEEEVKEVDDDDDDVVVITTQDRPNLRREIVLTWKGEMLPSCL